jgi:hypothetical protein
MRNIRFEERQNFPAWLWVLGACIFLGITIYLIYVYTAVSDALEDYVVLTWTTVLIINLYVMNMLYMVTRVDDRAVSVRFGRYFGLLRSRIPLAEVHNLRVVEYNPLWDAGGWWYKYGRFEGEPTRFLNARGNRGVYLEAKGHRYVIGSQEPERLYEVLRALAPSAEAQGRPEAMG